MDEWVSKKEREKERKCVCTCVYQQENVCVCISEGKIIKSMLNPSLPDSQFWQINLHWPPFLRISSISVFESWTRSRGVRSQLRRATFRMLDGRKKFIIHFSLEHELHFSPTTNQRADAIGITRSRVHILEVLFTYRVSAFPFLNYRGEEERRTVPFYVCKNHKA